MRSFVFFSTFVLSFALFQLVTARATNQQKRAEHDTSPNGVVNFIRDLFGLTARQEQVCVEDDIFTQLQNDPNANEFCNRFLGNPPDIFAVYTTPITTVVNTYTTITTTTTNTIQVAATVSAVVTLQAKAKRDLMKNRFDSGAVARYIRAAEVNGTATADSSFISALSSACSCQTLTAATTTVTYTEAVSTYTQRAYANTVQTVDTTITSGTVTTVLAGQTSSADLASSTSMSSAASLPTPTSPAIVCPDDDNSIDSQLIDGQLFQYLVQCDTDITDDDLAQYRYQTFTECAAACGSANYGFNSAVCQGAVFYPDADSGSNCFLKKSANSTVVAGGINAVILLRIEVAVNEPAIPSAVYLPSSAASSVVTSSMLSSIFQNSTTSMPIITPAPAKRLATSYSTYVSGGSTYSSAQIYSTYVSGNGSWYESYYTTYTVAWAASSTQEISYATSSSSNSGSNSDSSGSGNGGDSTSGSASSFSGNSTGGSGGNGGAASGSGSDSGSSSGYTITTTVYNNTETNGNQQIRNETIVTTYTWSNGTTTSSSTTTITQTTIGSSSGGTSGSSSDETGGASGSSGGSTSGSGGNSSGSTGGSSGGASGGGNGGAVTNGTIIVTNSTTVTNNTISTNGTAGGANGGSNGGSGGGAAGNVSTDIIVSTIFSTEISTVYLTASTPFSGSISDAGRSGSDSPPTSTPFPSLTPSFTINGTLSTSIPMYNSSSGAYVMPSVTGLPSGSPSPYANATTPSPFPATSMEGNRSGSATPPTTPYGFSNTSAPVGPTGTAPSTYSGSIPSLERSGTLALPSVTPISNSSGTVALSTGVLSLNKTTMAPSASFPFPTANSTFLLPTGTALSASFPFPTANSSVVIGPTGTEPSSGIALPSVNSSSSIGTGTYPSATGLRSGSLSPSGPSATFPSSKNGTCTDIPPVTVTMFSIITEAATTVYATTTLLGCYSNCPPAGQGYYGPFDGFPDPTPATTSAAE
ncbi:hypothetical protein QM012_001091 [Aureobasidium pullulans]|uniref:Apple domain-containing protein n=1 Tax=Aureobasidium pullulans TaxID=5580 RepID=A0ABR0TH58_AURPU